MKKTFFVVMVWYLAAVVPMYSQSTIPSPAVPLGSEIQNLERILSRPGASSAEKHDALVRLARLYQLSGDIENAAKNWLEAATFPPAAWTAPNQRDDFALIAGVYCLGAMGDWERAGAELGSLFMIALQGSRPVAGAVLIHARYLEACARLWGSTGDPAALAALAGNPEYAAIRPAIYYTLWKAAAGRGSPSADDWRMRLLADFPHSPEARIAAGGNTAAGPLISASPGIMWLYLSDSGSFAAVKPPAPAIVSPLPAPVAVLPSPPPVLPVLVPTQILQAGVFNSEANARSHAGRLKQAGFNSAVSFRTASGRADGRASGGADGGASGAEQWVVTVSPGPDINKTIKDLHDAGFDSFPVKN